MIDFEITANRPDCLSAPRHRSRGGDDLGPAAAEPALRDVDGPALSKVEGLDVTIEAPDLCPRYCAQVFEVKIGPSPQWLADRLTAAGVRPINNIVDVTNYVLLELGPADARLRSRVAWPSDRRRPPGPAPASEMRTLDGEERALEPDMLVIADAERREAVGGVMGGATPRSGQRRRASRSRAPGSCRRRSAARASGWA